MCCRSAVAEFGGDGVAALISSAKSEKYCSQRKARALWALGQLGAEEALPCLRENYGNTADKNLCVNEAQFAIQKIAEKRFNLPGFLWRRFLSN
jgi:HEAT repeat protein